MLVAVVCAVAIRPLIGDVGAGPLIFSSAMVLLLLVALLTIQIDELVGEREVLLAQRRRRAIMGCVLAFLAVVERLCVIISPTPFILLTGMIGWLAFFAFVSWSLLRTMLKHRDVTSETISMSISIYLMLGFTWGILYAVILQLQPNAFRFSDPTLALTAATESEVLPILIYFSLTTISTVGFGDIVPVTLPARYMAVTEGITGQFYLAILVARLVGMHMSQQEHGSGVSETKSK